MALKKVADVPIYADCRCGCGDYAEPPKSCAVCQWAIMWPEGVLCDLLSSGQALRWCPNRGKRKDCPIRAMHSEGLRYVT